MSTIGARIIVAGFLAATSVQANTEPRFADVTVAAGLDFKHTHGRESQDPTRYYIETMCGGVAFFDFDADGFQDAYGVNGQYIVPTTRSPASNRLFHNRGNGTFADVTAETHAGDQGYGMGVAAGDFDGDGFSDLYLTNYGANALLQNEEGHRFGQVATSFGVADSLWGVGAAFFDFDNDGDLDIYLANYVDYHLDDAHRVLRSYVAQGEGDLSISGYPHPDNFSAAADVLYRNEGDRFLDVTRQAGVYDPTGKGMGVAIADYDDDGDVDVFVANDRTENFLFQNAGDGTFVNAGLLSGTAYDRDGRLQSGMGADFADVNADGRLDLFLTVFQAETNALYINEGEGYFSDVAFTAGLAVPSLSKVSWGAVFLDYDNDGWRDLFVANGHVLDNAELFDSSSQFRQPDQLFRNLGGDSGRLRFALINDEAGEAISQLRASRGVAAGDYDNDGDTDLLLLVLNERARLLRNDGGNSRHWLTVRAIGGQGGNRDAIGARVRVMAGDLTQVDQVLGGGSYLSQSDLRLSFGLGEHAVVDSIEIRWPSGGYDLLGPVAADQIITVTQGSGQH